MAKMRIFLRIASLALALIIATGNKTAMGSLVQKELSDSDGIVANIQDYKIETGLKNVKNVEQFPNLTQEQIELIEKNGFVVSPTAQEQLFYIYEDNTYKKIPSFITTDSVLQVYHIFYDYLLRTSEVESFLPNAVQLNKNMLGEMIRIYDEVTVPQFKEYALTVIGYFGVAQVLFGEALPDDFPDQLKSVIESEAELVSKAEGYNESPLMKCEIDYSLFTPRGHYTRSEELTKYFCGISWYGIVPFAFYYENGERNIDSTLQAFIMSAGLFGMPDDDGLNLWQGIYGATSFMVGDSDDITPEQLYAVLENAFDGKVDIDKIEEKLDVLYNGIDQLEQPRINSKNKNDVTGLQLRFMGQRYIADSEIMQELVTPVLRPFPSGLDVLAVLGSKRAEELLAEIENPAEKWPEYTENFELLSEKFQNLPDSVWQSNVYYSWLDMLKSLLEVYGKGYPMFMQSEAWLDKSISTALGSWAELRHDTILYGKQSAAECGGGLEAPVVYGYVEPNPGVYGKLLRLTELTREFLTEAGLVSDSIGYKMDDFEQLLGFLLECSEKELNGEMLSARDYDQFLTYGGWLEYMTTSLSDGADKWFMIENETDKNMAVIADVHTATDAATGKSYYLEVGVGTAAEIYVVFPVGEELYLGRGAMFDYFEFKSETRLTDEAWQNIGLPERPPWTKNFMIPGSDTEIPVPTEPYSTGC